MKLGVNTVSPRLKLNAQSVQPLPVAKDLSDSVLTILKHTLGVLAAELMKVRAEADALKQRYELEAERLRHDMDLERLRVETEAAAKGAKTRGRH